jgi:hypothetical protein
LERLFFLLPPNLRDTAGQLGAIESAAFRVGWEMAAFSGVVSDSEVETLNFSLDDLSVEGTFRFEK